VVMESRVIGPTCKVKRGIGGTGAEIGFTTDNFTGVSGTHQAVVAWNFSWRVSLLAVVGSAVGGGAGAWYEVELAETELCDVSAPVAYGCTNFQRCCGSGTAYPGWSDSAWLYSGTLNQSFSASVKVFLNASFISSHSYDIVAAFFVETSTYAYRAGGLASAEIWMTLQYGYSSLSGITIT
jgi:hypothetical protein